MKSLGLVLLGLALMHCSKKSDNDTTPVDKGYVSTKGFFSSADMAAPTKDKATLDESTFRQQIAEKSTFIPGDLVDSSTGDSQSKNKDAGDKCIESLLKAATVTTSHNLTLEGEVDSSACMKLSVGDLPSGATLSSTLKFLLNFSCEKGLNDPSKGDCKDGAFYFINNIFLTATIDISGTSVEIKSVGGISLADGGSCRARIANKVRTFDDGCVSFANETTTTTPNGGNPEKKISFFSATSYGLVENIGGLNYASGYMTTILDNFSGKVTFLGADVAPKMEFISDDGQITVEGNWTPTASLVDNAASSAATRVGTALRRALEEL